MPGVKLPLPGQEVLDSDWGEGCELGPFEYGFFPDDLLFLDFDGPALNQVLMDPVPGFLDDVEDDWLFVAVEDDVLDLLGDVVDVVPGDAGDGFDFVLDGGEGVFLGELKHEVDLVLHLVADVGLAQHVELVRGSLLHHLKLIQIDVLQRSELVPLLSQVLYLHHNNPNQYIIHKHGLCLLVGQEPRQTQALEPPRARHLCPSPLTTTPRNLCPFLQHYTPIPSP